MIQQDRLLRVLLVLLLLPGGVAPAAEMSDAGATALGRDVKAKFGEDRTGFDFTKIGEDGQSLPKDAGKWVCVRDNMTGLLWEVKSDDGDLHDKDWTYSWYNSSGVNDSGFAGYAAGGFCGGTVAAGCDTEKFAATVNAAKMCGVTGWRLPSRQELLSIVDNSTGKPVVDRTYFPHVRSSGLWSSSPFIDGSYGGWGVGLDGVYVYGHEEDGSLDIILVNGGQ